MSIWTTSLVLISLKIWPQRTQGCVAHCASTVAAHQTLSKRPNKFRMAVIHGLVSATGRRTPAPNTYAVCEAPTRLTGRHFPGKNPGRTPKGKQVYPDCVVCSDRTKKRHQTEYICEECGVPMHLYPCFKRYHTLQCYKIACSKALHAE